MEHQVHCETLPQGSTNKVGSNKRHRLWSPMQTSCTFACSQSSLQRLEHLFGPWPQIYHFVFYVLYITESIIWRGGGLHDNLNSNLKQLHPLLSDSFQHKRELKPKDVSLGGEDCWGKFSVLFAVVAFVWLSCTCVYPSSLFSVTDFLLL